MSSRISLAGAVLLFALAGPVAAQPPAPPAGPPSPIELVRGLRSAGLADLALEYIKDAATLQMPEADRQALPLERAKCLLELAEEEADEGTRLGMVGEAKEAFTEFRDKNPTHPRVAEASIALARLTSIDAKIQLNRAKRIEPGEDSKLKEEQQKELEGARVLFKLASDRFAEAAKQIEAKLKQNKDQPRDGLKRESDEADLAAAINLYLTADTFIVENAKQVQDRAKYVDEARAAFARLANPTTSRAAWVARAWMGECQFNQSKVTEGENEFKAILAANVMEADDGKRMVRFFQARRNYLAAIQEPTLAKLGAAERELRSWLNRYNSATKPTPEALSARFYLAFVIQIQADAATVKPKNPQTGVAAPITVGPNAKRQYLEAEKLYRGLSQSDNDYTERAGKRRMYVARMALGEADQPVNSYDTFENAQMAALIQAAKLGDAEKELPGWQMKTEANKQNQRAMAFLAADAHRQRTEAEIKNRKHRILALLERARALATDKDNPGDVTDNLLRLVYFYQVNNQSYQSAVLGEHVARNLRTAGGKASQAGLLGVNGYIISAMKIKVDASDPDKNKAALEAADQARRLDRDRAMALARFVDEKFPNEPFTEHVRHRLASMLVEDRRLADAFDVLKKVRPGYPSIAAVRQLEGYVAATLITSPATDMPLPSGGKPALFRQAVNDLSRVIKPVPSAKEEEVKGYFSVRARLASLYLAQGRTGDKSLDAASGFEKALSIADEIIGSVSGFECLKGEGGKLNPRGMEMQFQGLDVRTRAIYLRGRFLVDAADHNWQKAAEAIEPAVKDVESTGAMYNQQMKDWQGADGDDDEAKAKRQAAALAQAVDRNRREIIMVGFKLRVRQGKKDEAAKMLDLLAKAGGSIEESQPTLEYMARDLASHIPALKKAGQAAEAKDMGDGLAILLNRLSELKNQTPASRLFLGQTLYLVEQYDGALKEFSQFPVPTPPKPMAAPGAAPPAPPGPASKGGNEWWLVDPNKLENNPDKKRFQDEVRDYRIAQLYTARCLRGLNKFAEAEKLLTNAVSAPPDKPGGTEKHGYAYASLDFRKELALLHEAKGASIQPVKEAGQEWGKALKEWVTLFNFARDGLSKLKEPTPEQERSAKNRFYDAYFDYLNCLLRANLQLRKNSPKLADTYPDVAKKIVEMENAHKFGDLEKKGTGIIAPDVWIRYSELLDKYPELKAAYKSAGGKFFLDHPSQGGQ